MTRNKMNKASLLTMLLQDTILSQTAAQDTGESVHPPYADYCALSYGVPNVDDAWSHLTD